jgi:hypothetical protein
VPSDVSLSWDRPISESRWEQLCCLDRLDVARVARFFRADPNPIGTPDRTGKKPDGYLSRLRRFSLLQRSHLPAWPIREAFADPLAGCLGGVHPIAIGRLAQGVEGGQGQSTSLGVR